MLITNLKKIYHYSLPTDEETELCEGCVSNQYNVTQIINGIDGIGSLTPGLCYSVQAPSLECHEYTKGGHSPAGGSMGKLLLGAQM